MRQYRPSKRVKKRDYYDLSAASRMAARELKGFFEAVRSYSEKQKEKSMTNINDYLKPGACVPVDQETTVALIEEIERLRREVEQLRVDKHFLNYILARFDLIEKQRVE